MRVNNIIFIIACAIIVLTILPITSAAWPSNLNNNLTTYYNFENTNEILNGIYNLLTNEGSGGNISSSTNCLIGKCGNLTTNNNWKVVYNQNMSMATTIFSGGALSVWVYPTAGGTGWRTAVDDFDGGEGYQFSTQVAAYNYQSYVQTGTGDMYNTSGIQLSQNAWHNLLITFNGSNFSLYVDGDFQDSKIISITNLSTFNISVGTSSYDGSRDFEGLIDELAFWGRALNSSEISQLYNNGRGITLSNFSTFDSINPYNNTNFTLFNTSIIDVNFTFNISSTNNLSNATIYIYNQTGTLVNQNTTTFASNVTNGLFGIVMRLTQDTYSWFFKVYDTSGNYDDALNNTASANISNGTNPFQFTLVPTTIGNSVTFNCTVNNTEYGIKEVSLLINNATNYTIYNSTENQSSLSLQRTYSFPTGTYNWSCSALNGNNDYSISEAQIFSITINVSSPSPVNNTNYTVYNKSFIDLNFTFNYSSLFNNTTNISNYNMNFTNATLYVYNGTGSIYNQTTLTTLSYTGQGLLGIVVRLTQGSYDWFYDLFNNFGERFITSNETITVNTSWSPNLDINLSHYWNFNNNTNDIFGILNGVVNGSETYQAGKHESSFFFNNTTYIDLGVNNTPSINSTDLKTFSFWYKTTYTTDTQIILANQGNSGIYLYLGSTRLGFYSANAGDYEVRTSTLPASSYDGNWHHIVIIRGGPAYNRIYFDGVSQTLDLNTTLFNNDNGKFYISERGNLDGYKIRGNLDEFAIWNRVLSSAEVAQLYHNGGGIDYPTGRIINQNYPANNAVFKNNSGSSNVVTFNCSANSTYGVKELSLMVDNSTVYIVDANNSTDYNYNFTYNLPYGKHNWSCAVLDGNYNYEDPLYNITSTGVININITYPNNITYTTIAPTALNYTLTNTSEALDKCYTYNANYTDWANSSYAYRKGITINSSEDASNYSTYMNLSYNSKMQSDFDDVRFYEGNTKLSYWIENKVDDSFADVWIMIPIINSSKTIYMYYGNNTVSNESNITNTFLFADDFNGNLIDTQMWNYSNYDSWVESGGVIYSTQTETDIDNLQSSFSIANATIEWKSKSTEGATHFQTIIARSNITSDYGHYYLTGAGYASKKLFISTNFTFPWVTNDDNSNTYYSTDTWYRFRFKMNGSTLNLTLLEDGSSIQGTDSDYTSGYIGLNHYANVSYDWIGVRTYLTTEPAVTVSSAETSYSLHIVNAGTNFTGLNASSGENNWTVYCNDSLGIVNQSSVIFTFSNYPTINITYPLNTTYNINVSQLNYTVTTDPSKCWYSTNGGTTNSTEVNFGINFTDILSNEGSNNWIVFCNNTAGGVGNNNITFFKDTIYPQINITYPQSGYNYSSLSRLSYNLIEINPSICKVTNNNGTTNTTFICKNSSITSGLVSYWDFNDGSGINLSNQMNGSLNGTLINSPSWITGKIGGALNFNGSSQYISLDKPSALEPSQQLSASLWFRTNSSNSMDIFRDRSNGYDIGMNLGYGAGKILVEVWDNTPAAHTMITTGTYNDGNWHNLIITYNDSLMILYIDGNQISNTSTGGTGIYYVPDGGPITFGRSGGYNGNYYTGDIDEAGFWNRSLTAVEVSQLYNSGAGFSYTPYLNYSQGSNTWTIYANDTAGNSNSSSVTFVYDTIAPQINLTYPVPASQWTPSLNTKLIDYWKMDEISGTAVNNSIRSNNGTMSSSLGWIPGKINNAFDFTVPDYMDVVSGPGTSGILSDFSVFMWIRTNDTGHNSLYEFSDITDSCGINFRINDLGILGAAALGIAGFSSPGPPLNNDSWHLVGMTITPDLMYHLYVDNVEVYTTGPYSVNLSTCSGLQVRIGALRQGTWFYPGQIDEIGVWNRSLTSPEITDLYNNGNGKSYSPLYTFINNSTVNFTWVINENSNRLFEYYSGSIDTYFLSTPGREGGQTFTPGTLTSGPFILDKISMSFASDGSLSGNVNVSIYATNGTFPIGSSLSQAVMSTAGISNYPTWTIRNITMPPITLQNGTMYAIVISKTQAGELRWPTHGADSYAGGACIDNTSTWIYCTGLQQENLFEVWGYNVSSGIQNTTIYVYNATNGTLINQTTKQSYELSNIFSTTIVLPMVLVDGIYSWFADVFDFAGNYNATSNQTFTLDTIYPQVNFSTGTIANSSNVSRNFIWTWLYMNVSVIDATSFNTSFILYNSTSNTIINWTNYTDGTTSLNLTNLSNGHYSYEVNVTDSVGNQNSSGLLTVTIDTVPPTVSKLYPTSGTYYYVNRSSNLGYYNISNIKTTPMIIDYAIPTVWNNTYNLSAGCAADANAISTGCIYYCYRWDISTWVAIGSQYLVLGYWPNPNQFANYSIPSYCINRLDNYTDYITIKYYGDDVFNFATGIVANGSLNWWWQQRYNLAAINNNTVPFNFTVNDTTSGIYNVTLSVYNNSGSLINNTTKTYSELNLNNNQISIPINLSDGRYMWDVSSYDFANNFFDPNDTIIVDTIYPEINYTTPTEENATNKSQNWIYVNVTVNETNEANITFRLYNSIYTLINNTTYTDNRTYENFTGLSNGIYYYNVTITDLANNQNTTETRKITLDTIAPEINQTNPLNNSYSSSNNISFNWTVNDSTSGIFNTTIYVYNQTSGSLVNNTTKISDDLTNIFNTILGVPMTLADGIYNWFVDVWDFANNYNYTSNNTLTVDTGVPSYIYFIDPTKSNNTYENSNWIYAKTSFDNTNLANLTFYLYNYTSGLLLNNTTYSSFENLYSVKLEGGGSSSISAGLSKVINLTGINSLIYDFNRTATADPGCFLELNSTRIAPLITGTNQIINLSNYFGYYLVNFTCYGGEDWCGPSTGYIDNINFVTSESYYSPYTISVSNPTYYSFTKLGTPNISNISYYYDNDYSTTSAYTTSDAGTGWTNESWNVSSMNNYSIYYRLRLSKIIILPLQVYNHTSGSYVNITDYINYNTADNSSLSSYVRVYNLSSYPEFINSGMINLSVYVYRSGNIFGCTYNWDSPSYYESDMGYFNNTSITPTASQNLSTFESGWDGWTNNTYTSRISAGFSTITNNSINWTDLSDGKYLYNATAVKLTTGNNSTETRWITLDTVNPLINYSSGINSNNSIINNRNWTYVNVTLTEVNQKMINFTIYKNGTLYSYYNNSSLLSYGLTSYDYNFTGLPDGNYTYNVTAEDQVNRTNSTPTMRIIIDMNAPNATNIAPANYTNTSNTSINFTLAANDSFGLKNATLFVYNATGQYSNATTYYIFNPEGVASQTIGIVLTMVEGTYRWFFKVFDMGGLSTDTQNYSLDIITTYPNVSAIFPVNGTNYTNATTISAFNYTVSGTNLSQCWYSINGGANSTPIAYGINFTGLTAIDQFTNNYTAYCNNTAGLVGRNTTIFNLDTVAPVITITSPIGVDYAKINGEIDLNFTVTDGFLSNCWYYYNGTNTSISCTSGIPAHKSLGLNGTSVNMTNNFMIFYANDTHGNLANHTIYWYYKILENIRYYNTSTYETDWQTFTINANQTGNATVSATLVYNGISYATKKIGTNYGAANFTINLSIPTGVGNKTFYWNFAYLNGSTQTIPTNTSNQSVNLTLLFVPCNSTSMVNYANITFYDEISNNPITAHINQLTWVYWLGNSSINKTLIYANSTSYNYNYTFCAVPYNRTIYSAITALYYEHVSTGGGDPNYPQRIYSNATVVMSNNSLTHIPLPLLSAADGKWVQILAADSGGLAIPGVDVLVTRSIGGIETVMGHTTTDAAGSATFFLSPSFPHTFYLSKSGCSNVTSVITPTAASYVITMACQSIVPSTPGSTSLEGIRYWRYPIPGVIGSIGNTTFSYYVDSSINPIVRAYFTLSHSNGTIISTNQSNIGTNYCNATSCFLTMTYNVKLGDSIKGAFYVDVGTGYILLDGDAWWRLLGVYTDAPNIKNFFKHLNEFTSNWNNVDNCGDYETQAICEGKGCLWNNTTSTCSVIKICSDYGLIGNQSERYDNCMANGCWYENATNTCYNFALKNRQEFSRILLVFLVLAIILAIFGRITGYDAQNPGVFLIFLTGVILFGSFSNGFGGPGYFYYSDLTQFKIFNNWILFITTGMMSAGYWASVIRRQT